MLGRTADSVFWMARYIERADNVARLIEMGRRMNATPLQSRGHRSDWRNVLSASGGGATFFEHYDTPDRKAVIAYLLLDRRNPSSVASCIEAARANARAARTALTVEMWEAINEAWIEIRRMKPEDLSNGSLAPLLDWLKQRSALFQGAADASALRNDSFEFLHLGTFIERFDCAARLLDVKFRAETAAPGDGDPIDQAHWMSLLMAAGALRAFQATYRADADRARIAHFLMLNRACPRSLAYCAEQVSRGLDTLSRYYSAAPLCAHMARSLEQEMQRASITKILDSGPQEFLSRAIARNNHIASAIAEAYYFLPPAIGEGLGAESKIVADEAAKAAEVEAEIDDDTEADDAPMPTRSVQSQTMGDMGAMQSSN